MKSRNARFPRDYCPYSKHRKIVITLCCFLESRETVFSYPHNGLPKPQCIFSYVMWFARTGQAAKCFDLVIEKKLQGSVQNAAPSKKAYYLGIGTIYYIWEACLLIIDSRSYD